MLNVLNAHPYLVANLPLLVTVVVFGSSIRPREIGRIVVPAGLLCIPSALITFTFQGDYWTPDRVGGLMIGIEDVIFYFDAGALAWLLACDPAGKTVVLLETWWVLTRRLAIPLTEDDASKVIQELGTLPVISTDAELVKQTIECGRRFDIAIWDALIIEAARAGGCGRVISEDLNSGQNFDGVAVENPFSP